MTACIVGWAHTPFGKLDAETVESLVIRVANEALADAGIGAADVDEIVLGHFNAGFSAQDFTASLVLQANPDLRFKRATRVENACATGSAAVHQGLKAIEAKAARTVDGLPAYTDAEPVKHSMETGAPHARYAVLERRRSADPWRVTFRVVAYDWNAAAARGFSASASSTRPICASRYEM